jgi:hypothetical protein
MLHCQRLSDNEKKSNSEIHFKRNSNLVLRHFVEFKNVEPQNVEIQIVDFKMQT